MPDAQHLAAIDTLLAIVLMIALTMRTGRMRIVHKIQAPATSGHPEFERAYRTHQNTVENFVLYVPALWIASVFYGGSIPFYIGLLWIIGRIAYAIGYAQQNAELRGPGFLASGLSALALIVLGAMGIAS
jgi:glutathione S-transferase